MKISVKTVGSVTVFIAESSFHEKDVVKQAGFRWHDPAKGPCWSKNCAGCACSVGKTWWTDRKENAARLLEWCSPMAKIALAETIATVEASRAHAPAIDVDIPAPEGLSYRPFQKAGIAFLLAAFGRGVRGCLQGDEMGLGKTIQALGLINADPMINRVLVVCPNSLRLNWQREAAKWLVRPMTSCLAGKGVDPTQFDLVIVNYDKLVGTGGKALHSVLMSVEWDLLIADESQALKNPKAQRTVAVLRGKGADWRGDNGGLITKTKRFLAMSGTPIPNRPVEAHPVLEACDPTSFPFFPYVKRFCAAKQFTPYHGATPVWDFSGASNLEELQAKLRSTIMVRRLKVDVLAELPPKERQVVVFPAEGKPSRSLESDFQRAVAALEVGDTASFTEFSAQRHEEALAKAPRCVEFIREVLEGNDGRKLVVFAHHKDVIATLMDTFGPSGTCEAVALTGDSSVQERQEAVDSFQTDPKVRLFVGSLMASGVGLTLTASSHVIFVEEDWVPANLTQAEDRTHRIGQEGSVLVQHLVVDGTIDALMIKVIVAKQEVSDRALDRRETFVIPPPQERRGRDGRPLPKHPVATPAERTWAAEVVRYLADCCDGAATEDGAGFNKLDTNLGKSIAQRSYERSLTDGEVAVVRKFAVKYRGQLASTSQPAKPVVES